MTRKLRIAPDLSLPIDAVTETFGILAKKGAGKSNAAVVMAEEMTEAGIPWVAVDPKGDWWGIRSSASGKGPGLPIVVFGGRHGDVPLEPTAGALLADLVLEHRLSCVLDVSEFSKTDVRRFLLAFAERLYRQAEDDPLHLFLEEAHEYLPQMVRGEDAHLVNAWQRIVKQGRFKGLGCTLVSQRSASLNKDVLTQVDTLIVLRTTAPQDRAAVKAWVDVHAESHDMLNTLPSLESGEAWVWSPEFLGSLTRIRFRRRKTFDSGATPKVGQKRRAPASLADVDLAAIKERMAETIEKVKAEDPKELNRLIRDLRREVKELHAAKPEPVIERVEVPVLTEQDLETFANMTSELTKFLTTVESRVARFAEPRESKQSPPRRVRGGHSSSDRPVADLTPPPRAAPLQQGDDFRLGKTERSILTVLAQHGARTHDQLALLTGYSRKASTIGVALGKLRKAGLVEPNAPIRATQAGVDQLGSDYEPLPEGEDLLQYWRNKFGKTERLVLDAVLSVHPGETSQAEIAELTGYSPSASTIGVALGKLRKVGVIQGWRISDDFAEMAGL